MSGRQSGLIKHAVRLRAALTAIKRRMIGVRPLLGPNLTPSAAFIIVRTAGRWSPGKSAKQQAKQ